MEAVKNRRSIRGYASAPIESEKLAAVCEAFRTAPSARNSQNWKLIAVSDSKARARVCAATLGSPDWLAQAPVILVACGTKQGVMTNGHRADSIDVSIATTCAMLQAWELGLGTCWMASYREDKMRDALGLEDDISIVAITPLGYPAESPALRPRKQADEVIEYR